MKSINQVLNWFTRSENPIELVDAFFIKVVLFGIIISLFGVINNIIIDLPLESVLINLSSTIVLIGIYILARFKNKFTLAKHLFNLTIFVSLNFLWFYNGGVDGPTLLVFVAFFIVLIFFTEGKMQTYTIITFGINILVLFYFQYYYPNYIIDYTSKFQQITDHFLLMIVFLTMMVPMLLYVQQNYNQQKKKAEESEELKSSFLANMSHEIRTPMNSILGFSELLRDPDLNDSEKGYYLDIIRSNGQVLLHLLNNIMELSKLDSNLISINEGPVHVRKLMEQIQLSFKNDFDSKPSLKLELNIPYNEAELTIISDELFLYQILSNLVSNALKYSNKGIIQMGYTIPSIRDNLVIFVSDTGMGMDVKTRSIIFDRFRQGDEKYSRKHGGMGLGLAICKELTQVLGGEIWVESAEGVGSTFYFSVPMVFARNEKVQFNKYQLN